MRGREVWYYTTQMTIDRDSLSDIRAQLGLGAFALKVDGWLVWTVSRWPGARAPIVSAGATGWDPESFPGSNGGGSYFCMGPNGRPLATLRAEAIRDGIEDHAILSPVPDGTAVVKSSEVLVRSDSTESGWRCPFRNGLGSSGRGCVEDCTVAVSVRDATPLA